MFERFTDRARRVLVLAQEEARLLNHSFIGTEHILLGLLSEGEGIAAQVLVQMGISLEVVRVTVEDTIGPAGAAPTGSPPFTPRAKKVLELSLREALQLGHNYIGTEHMLLGLLREGEGVAAQVLMSLGADLLRTRQQVLQMLSGYKGEDPSVGTRHDPFQPTPRGNPLRTGVTWRIEVVVAGRGEAQALAAYAELAENLGRAGFDLDELDPHAIVVSSVETEDGAGLRCVVTIEPPPDPDATPQADAPDAPDAPDAVDAADAADGN